MSEKSRRPEKSENLRPIYFQPGELVFHAHGDLHTMPGMADELIKWANEIASQEISDEIAISGPDDIFAFTPPANIDPKKQRELYERRAAIAKRQAERKDLSSDSKTLYEPPPLKNPPAFSLVFVKVEKKGWPEFLTDSKNPEEDDVAQEQADALDELLEIATLLDRKRGDAPVEVELEVVSPNWLMSGSSSDPGGTGGPGGRPSPVDQSDTDKYDIFPILPQNSDFFQDFEVVAQPEAGEGIVVAILDTAYKAEQLEDFYETWVLDRSAKPHPILKNLLDHDPSHPGALREPGGQIRVHTDPAVDNYLPGLMIDGHYDYDMTDHGLFVAGIINLLAPKAEIHLYQVLNKYGLGDLRSIARALEQVLKDFQERQFVVNLSLTMNFPLEPRHLRANDGLRVGHAILQRGHWLDRQGGMFESICDLVYSLDSRVIAAAGNQSESRDNRPAALYPAAFDRVLGVGALADDTGSVVPATYSNLADQPTNQGITTFGGEPGEGEGVLSVYVGPFPDGSPNENGWAWWCGTSFATPIISGITAAVLSKLPQGSIVEDAILMLFEAQGDTTNAIEDVFAVTQGPLSP